MLLLSFVTLLLKTTIAAVYFKEDNSLTSIIPRIQGKLPTIVNIDVTIRNYK